MEGVRQRKRDMVDGMIAIHRNKFDVPHLEFVLGEGRVVAPKTVEVQLAAGGTRTFVAERLFLNLGTHAAVPDVPGLAGAAPLTHVEALELGRLLSHLVVLGGGYVGVELVQAFRRLVSKVSVLEFGAQLLGREDPDVAAAVRAVFEEDGIHVVVRSCRHERPGRAPDRHRDSVEGSRLRNDRHGNFAASPRARRARLLLL